MRVKRCNWALHQGGQDYLLMFLLSACGSANVFIKPGTKIDNKIAIGSVNLKLDGAYDQAESNVFLDSLTTQFLKAGFNVMEGGLIDKIRADHYSANDGPLSQESAMQVGKMMNVKYVVVCKGTLQQVNDSIFVENASVKFINADTGQTDISGTFSGSGVRTVGASDKIGNELIAKIKELQ